METSIEQSPVGNVEQPTTYAVALTKSLFDGVSESSRFSMAQTAELLSTVHEGKKDGAGWMPADIQPGPRTQDRVQAVSLLVLDIEAKCEALKDEDGNALLDDNGDVIKRVVGPLPPSIEHIVEELRQCKLAAIIHTSYSHTVENPRYRIVFALTRPLIQTVDGHELKVIAPEVAAELGLLECVDRSCFDAARMYYLPRARKDRLELFRYADVEGAPVDVDAIVARATAKGKALSSAHSSSAAPESSGLISAFNAANPIGSILGDHGYEAHPRGRWLAPGSTTGIPGVHLLPSTNGRELVFSHHANDPLSDGRAHDSFDVHRILSHGGDLHSAIKDAQLIKKSLTNSEYSASTAEVPRGRFTFLSVDDVMSFPLPEWRIRGILPATGVACVYGPSGTGKTFLVTEMGAAISMGRPFFGNTVTQAPVVYLCLEGSGGMTKRLRGMNLKLGEAAFGDMRFSFDPFSILDEGDVEAFTKAVKIDKLHGGVIIIDTLHRSMVGGDENTATDMGRVIEAATRIQSAMQGLVVFVHHTGKDSDRGLRGHSSLFAALDAVIEVTRSNSERSFRVAKSKEADDGTWKSFDLEEVIVGADPDGLPITTCVTVGRDNERPGEYTLSPQTRDVLSALQSCVDESGHDEVASPGIGITQWQEKFLSETERNGTQRASRLKAFNRGVASLLDAKLVTICDEVAHLNVEREDAACPGH